jgi:coenzyme F420-reducing hydrogenase beta subunit
VGSGDSLAFALRDGRFVYTAHAEVHDLAQDACLACAEFASDYADIAVGDLGSPEGYATVVIRTDRGSRVYDGALRQGYIEERPIQGGSELRSETTRMLATIVARARRKRTRGERKMEELVAA